MTKAKTLTLRGVTLGAGLPKIAVPIVGRTRAEILAQAEEAAALPADLVEWRADCCDALGDEAALLETARLLRGALGERPLLFTIRTRREGGEAAPDSARYAALCLAAARSGCVDLLDAEASVGEPYLGELLDGAHAAGVPVVGSRHDFAATPPEDEMLSWLRAAQARGVDVPKLAVTPRSDADVLALLSASAAFRERYADRPFVTISMGPRGALSRVACELSGSCVTFGCAGRVSAPGQIPAGELKELLLRIRAISQA